MTTDHTAFRKQVTPLIEFLQKQGAPPLPDWVQLTYPTPPYGPNDVIECSRVYGQDLCDCVDNHHAVTTAVCMWVMDVCMWDVTSERGTRHQKHYWTAPYASSRCGWLWNMKRFSTKELAFLALLTAICEALGYEGEVKDGSR